MSVLVDIDGKLFLFSKGAPEVIFQYVQNAPESIEETLHSFTEKGYRVLACAIRRLDSKNREECVKMSRDCLEMDLELIGLIVFENKLKPETQPVIHQLKSSNLRCIMATGDNVLTAVYVSRQCEMVDPKSPIYMSISNGSSIEWKMLYHDEFPELPQVIPFSEFQQTVFLANASLAVSGTHFERIRREFSQENYELLLRKAVVFARLSPQSKKLLVEDLKSLDLCVLMCGDGANDCGALKAADVGISLSEAEASIAAPFTSKVQNVSCVPILIKEGRAALSTSFSCFKFMSLYSLTEFTAVVLQYSYVGNMGDLQYLFLDLFLALPLVIFRNRIAKEYSH
jgi:cation-transporting ATPase 13A3/4/5